MTGPIRGIATPTNACAAAVLEHVQVGNKRSNDGRWLWGYRCSSGFTSIEMGEA
jgi:hypothetical protein